MQRASGVTLVLGICAAALVAGSAHADTNPFLGRWHWNRTQSTLPPNEPAPSDLTAEISRGNGQHLSWSITVVTSDGESHTEKFDAVPDGAFQPVSSDTTAAFHLTNDMLQATFKGPSGQSDSLSCGVSPDQQRMTCKGTVNDGAGQTSDYVDVYDRT
jgi:hypothetical protein